MHMLTFPCLQPLNAVQISHCLLDLALWGELLNVECMLASIGKLMLWSVDNAWVYVVLPCLPRLTAGMDKANIIAFCYVWKIQSSCGGFRLLQTCSIFRLQAALLRDSLTCVGENTMTNGQIPRGFHAPTQRYQHTPRERIIPQV